MITWRPIVKALLSSCLCGCWLHAFVWQLVWFQLESLLTSTWEARAPKMAAQHKMALAIRILTSTLSLMFQAKIMCPGSQHLASANLLTRQICKSSMSARVWDPNCHSESQVPSKTGKMTLKAANHWFWTTTSKWRRLRQSRSTPAYWRTSQLTNERERERLNNLRP